MINIKSCLRISVHKLVKIAWIYIDVYNRFSTDWFVSSSQVLDSSPRFSSGLRSVVVICHIHM